jgi:hypothetical protein
VTFLDFAMARGRRAWTRLRLNPGYLLHRVRDTWSITRACDIVRSLQEHLDIAAPEEII